MTGHPNTAIGACREFLRAAQPGGTFSSEAAHVLRAPDLDWDWLSRYLVGSGLARPLLPSLADPVLVRCVPRHVRQSLLQCGMCDVMRERAQRDIVGRIGDALHALGSQGVLLKGSAFLMRAPLGSVSRATTDVDVLVDSASAPRLRAHLLARGFNGIPGAAPSTSHHLEPIWRDGVNVEIHTRIMPAFWGLPEETMLASLDRVPDTDSLLTLDAEGLVLHAVTHLSASFYSFGMKAAWDVLAAMRIAPGLDWARVGHWASSSRLPRAFWVPAKLLVRGFALPIPPALLTAMPDDPGARRAEIIAGDRMFSATEGLSDLDAITKTRFVLALHEDWRGQIAYLRQALGWRASRPATWRAAAARARHAHVFQHAWRYYRRYRRA